MIGLGVSLFIIFFGSEVLLFLKFLTKKITTRVVPIGVVAVEIYSVS